MSTTQATIRYVKANIKLPVIPFWVDTDRIVSWTRNREIAWAMHHLSCGHQAWMLTPLGEHKRHNKDSITVWEQIAAKTTTMVKECIVTPNMLTVVMMSGAVVKFDAYYTIALSVGPTWVVMYWAHDESFVTVAVKDNITVTSNWPMNDKRAFKVLADESIKAYTALQDMQDPSHGILTQKEVITKAWGSTSTKVHQRARKLMSIIHKECINWWQVPVTSHFYRKDEEGGMTKVTISDEETIEQQLASYWPGVIDTESSSVCSTPRVPNVSNIEDVAEKVDPEMVPGLSAVADEGKLSLYESDLVRTEHYGSSFSSLKQATNRLDDDDGSCSALRHFTREPAYSCLSMAPRRAGRDYHRVVFGATTSDMHEQLAALGGEFASALAIDREMTVDASRPLFTTWFPIDGPTE